MQWSSVTPLTTPVGRTSKPRVLPDTTLDLDHPNWRGAFWLIYPERSGAPVTNEVTLDGPRCHCLDRPYFVCAERAANVCQTKTASASTVAGVRNLPVLLDTLDDPIHIAAERIATLTATALLNTSEGKALCRLPSHMRSNRSGGFIVAHELIWPWPKTSLKMAACFVRPPTAGRPTPVST